MHVIDLRSDTVTLPTKAMRMAMHDAELGDDVYGEDPTINRLQEVAADRLGKEAALFVVSGTMGNLVSLLTHCGRGEEIILGDQAHIFVYEAGGVSALGGVQVHTIPNTARGMLNLADVEDAIRGDNPHFPRTRAICLENTHNRCGGAVLTPAEMASIKGIAEAHGLVVHLDGARIFNAAEALGVDVREISAQADSVQFCFSKGLSAPVGSMICGSAEFIAEARRTRKTVGGGLRQGGVIAAAALVAIEQMVDRLSEDHENAQILARGLAEIDKISVDPDAVQTNIIMIDVLHPTTDAQSVSEALALEGVKISAVSQKRLRAVTHYGISDQDVKEAIAVVQKVMKSI